MQWELFAGTYTILKTVIMMVFTIWNSGDWVETLSALTEDENGNGKWSISIEPITG